jgi:vancomycin permeability regulator SanA
VVVLGHPARRNGRPHPVQRARVRAAVTVFRAVHADRLVMCGGARKNATVEADVMVALARELGVDTAALVAERASTTTWENVREAEALVRDCAAVHLVSQPLHAARARRYWLRQFPGDADRVFVTLGDVDTRWWIAAPIAAYELAIMVRDRIRRPVQTR